MSLSCSHCLGSSSKMSVGQENVYPVEVPGNLLISISILQGFSMNTGFLNVDFVFQGRVLAYMTFYVLTHQDGLFKWICRHLLLLVIPKTRLPAMQLSLHIMLVAGIFLLYFHLYSYQLVYDIVYLGPASVCWKSCLTFSDPRDRLEKLMKQPGNKYCADCGSPKPKWV